jgi:hypothetical protein
MERNEKQETTYESPRVVDYGDLVELTQRQVTPPPIVDADFQQGQSATFSAP